LFFKINFKGVKLSQLEEITAKNKQAFEKFSDRNKRVVDYFGDLLKTKEVVPIYNKLFGIKMELNEFFKKNLRDVCSTCHGNCCRRYVLEIIGNEDFLMWGFFNFKLPEPDWDFLAEKESAKFSFAPCIFLGRNGCLLGEMKPFYCMSYVGLTDCDPGMHRLGKRDFTVAEKLIAEYREYSFK